MAGSIIPDLIDKPLGLVFPSVLGGGRTVFHTLIIVGIMLLCIVIFARSASRWLGAGMACAVLLHQVMDEMWILPANWLYPFFGPFQGHMIPDYIGIYFWNEMSDPSEWMFVIGAVMILALAYPFLVPRRCRSDRMKNRHPGHSCHGIPYHGGVPCRCRNYRIQPPHSSPRIMPDYPW